MLKKISAYSFIILANFLLFAHAVVPHHHHQSIACIGSFQSEEKNNKQNHSSQKDNHQHDDSSVNCILKQAFIVPPGNGRNEACYDSCSPNHSPDLHFILPYTGYENIISSSVTVTSDHFVSFSFSSNVTSSLGLRAPPAV